MVWRFKGAYQLNHQGTQWRDCPERVFFWWVLHLTILQESGWISCKRLVWKWGWSQQLWCGMGKNPFEQNCHLSQTILSMGRGLQLAYHKQPQRTWTSWCEIPYENIWPIWIWSRSGQSCTHQNIHRNLPPKSHQWDRRSKTFVYRKSLYSWRSFFLITSSLKVDSNMKNQAEMTPALFVMP